MIGQLFRVFQGVRKDTRTPTNARRTVESCTFMPTIRSALACAQQIAHKYNRRQDNQKHLQIERRRISELGPEIVGHVGRSREENAIGTKGAEDAQPLQVGALVFPVSR